MRQRVARLLMLAGLAVGGSAAGASAVQPDRDGAPAEALRCWRRVDRNAVRVGERFTMTLTCRVVETDAARAVPDLAGLEPETLDAPPFEVLDGERFVRARAGAGRLIQYHYTLRLIGEDHFGRDVEIPPLALNYRIERRTDDGELLPGRELTYVLPGESVRVLSLVPDAHGDIREPSPGTLGAAEARRFRADLALLAAAGLGSAALGLLAVGVGRARRARRGAGEREARPVAAWPVAQAVVGELTALRRHSPTAGWTRDALQRALAALRLAAALALQRPVAERADDAARAPRAGELRVRSGLLRARTVVVSSALTPAALADAAGRRTTEAAAGPLPQGDLERLRRSLAAFSAARYGLAGAPETDLLDRELDHALAAIRPLGIRTLAPVRRMRRAAAAVERWRRAWTR